jgi:hypothetical protein
MNFFEHAPQVAFQKVCHRLDNLRPSAPIPVDCALSVRMTSVVSLYR